MGTAGWSRLPYTSVSGRLPVSYSSVTRWLLQMTRSALSVGSVKPPSSEKNASTPTT
jgi:hypothetical protein